MVFVHSTIWGEIMSYHYIGLKIQTGLGTERCAVFWGKGELLSHCHFFSVYREKTRFANIHHIMYPLLTLVLSLDKKLKQKSAFHCAVISHSSLDLLLLTP